MLKFIGKTFKFLWFTSLILLIGIVLVILHVGWNVFGTYLPAPLSIGGDEPRVPKTISEAVETACSQVPKALPQPEIALQPTLILPFENDRQELVTQTLRDQLAEHGNYHPVDPAPLQQLIEQFVGSEGPVTEPKTAIELAKKAEAERVILGEVTELKIPDEHKDEEALATIKIRMFDVETGEELFEKSFTSRPPPKPKKRVASTDQPSIANSDGTDDNADATTLGLTEGEGTTSPWYLGAVVGFALLWPLLLAPAMKRVLNAENNGLTLLLMLFTILVPVALGFPWAFVDAGSIWRIVVFVAAGGLAAAWSLYVMGKVSEFHTPYA